MDDTDALYGLLTRFFAHERQEVADFNKAVKQFAADLPEILKALRERIAEKRAASRAFAAAETAFLDHARDAINPAVSEDDVQEMLIQHILTEDIFAKVFDNPDFHRLNNVAAELKRLEDVLFGRGEKAGLLRALAPYYAGIASTAALISSHSEKQGFLKALYEDFYKAYNKKAADRLGVVYTPGEIVRFMIRSADWLCEKHFGRNLIDRGVEILDPATGTGTFIVELLEYFRGDRDKLRHKYKEELHANEVAILPYYVANLNIEATYQAITGQFAEYENLCLVDTLDNVDALGIHAGYQHDLLGGLADENMERVKRQNRRKISVIIGNPPYNAWQQSYTQNNANRPHARVDARIKQTYIKEGTSQNQNSVYDMYTRFVRWASDRLGDEGIIVFVIGRKPIAKGAYDGFRKSLEREFIDIWLMDLGGDIRDNPKLSGTAHNVFGIQTGVMVAVLVKRRDPKNVSIHYARRPETELAEDKLTWLGHVGSFQHIPTITVTPDSRHDWLDQPTGDWGDFFALADTTKGADFTGREPRAIFRLTSNGIETGRDEWLWSCSADDLRTKVGAFLGAYNAAVKSKSGTSELKLDRQLGRRLHARQTIAKDEDSFRIGLSRPFIKKPVYFDRNLNAYTFRLPAMYPNQTPNPTIMQLGMAAQASFSSLATDNLFDFGVLKTGNGRTQGVSRYRYTKFGERVDNITDWALGEFVAHYGKKSVTKDAIFHYVYAVLHDPVYRETYALNLKREFPRIPLYPDFARWAAWGETLMAMHIGYEDVEPWPVVRVEEDPHPASPAKAGEGEEGGEGKDRKKRRAEGIAPKPILKSHAERGLVVIDADTQISGIPPEAWTYRLGNRSAIDWVLDQHKEKTPRDPTIREKFNTYRFADYKESMIALLAKVVRVSVDTVAITQAMTVLDRKDWSVG